MENMIRFKLCKMYNSVEIEFEDFSDIQFDLIEEIYDRMPDCKTSEVTPEDKPSEAQIAYAKSLGIDVKGMSKKELQKAIKNSISK